jgi:hypothetical protein
MCVIPRPVPQRADHAQHDGESATVVADAGAAEHRPFAGDLDVRLLRKHRIEVRAEDEVGPRRRAGPLAEHVAHLVHAHVLQAKRAERVGVGLATRGFLERRRRDLAQPDLVLDRLRFVVTRRLDRGFDRGVLQEPGTYVRSLLRERRRRENDRSEKDSCHRTSNHPGSLAQFRLPA